MSIGFSPNGIAPAGSIGTAQIADGAVTEAKIDPVYRSMIDPLSTFPSYGTVYGLFAGPGCTDFLNAGFGIAPYSVATSGTASNVVDPSGSSTRPGVAELQTGTDATGRATVRGGLGSLGFGGGVWRFRADGNLAVASDGTNTYLGYAGFLDSASAEPTDGAYFRYQHTENSGNWTCVTRAAGVETASDSGVAAVHATAYRALEIQVNAAASQVLFYIDGVLVRTETATIPSGSQLTGAAVNIRKTLGATSRSFLIDLMGSRFAATAGR